MSVIETDTEAGAGVLEAATVVAALHGAPHHRRDVDGTREDD